MKYMSECISKLSIRFIVHIAYYCQNVLLKNALHLFAVPKKCIIKESLMKIRYDMPHFLLFIWSENVGRNGPEETVCIDQGVR